MQTLASVPGLPRSVRILIMHRWLTFEKWGTHKHIYFIVGGMEGGREGRADVSREGLPSNHSLGLTTHSASLSLVL